MFTIGYSLFNWIQISKESYKLSNMADAFDKLRMMEDEMNKYFFKNVCSGFTNGMLI